jgi:predicted nucleotidyltransferase
MALSDLTSPQAVALRRHRTDVLEVLRAAGARNARLFGSVARGDATPESDIDLLVEFDTSDRGLLPLLELNDRLTAMLGFPVDVAPEDALRPAIAESARADAVPL